LITPGQWQPSTWLIVKLVFVLILSELHGVLTGRLPHIAKGASLVPPR